MLCHSMSYHAVHAVPQRGNVCACCATPYRVMLCHTMSCHAVHAVPLWANVCCMLCRTMLRYAVHAVAANMREHKVTMHFAFAQSV